MTATMDTLRALNCDLCGHFIANGQGDRYGPWGGAGDQEPPDPVQMCGRCVEREFRRYLAMLLREGIPPHAARVYYEPPDYYYRARAIARAMFRHGSPRRVRHERVRWATSGTREVWWCANCGRPERHPAHDLTEARHVHVRWCQFQRAVGRHLGTAKAQEWCACGWTTGALPLNDRPRRVDYLGDGTLIRDHVASAQP